MLRVVIADDERPARDRLRELLAAHADVVIAAEAADGLEAIEVIERERPDVVFLDVEMPELDGFEVLAALQNQLPLVVFATAFGHYAVRAFEEHAVDYVMKPVSRERLDQAIGRTRERVSAGRKAKDDLRRFLRELQPKHPHRLAVKLGDRTRVVQTAAIDWVEAAGNYVTIHTGNEKYVVRSSMTDIEAKLPPQMFARIHRSIIVNATRIVELRPAANRGDATVVLNNGRELPLSRSFRNRLAGLVADL